MNKLKTGEMFVKSITVDGKEIHAGADLKYDVDENQGLITLQTEIGQNKKQNLVVILSQDDTKLIVDEKDKISDN